MTRSQRNISNKVSGLPKSKSRAFPDPKALKSQLTGIAIPLHKLLSERPNMINEAVSGKVNSQMIATPGVLDTTRMRGINVYELQHIGFD